MSPRDELKATHRRLTDALGDALKRGDHTAATAIYADLRAANVKLANAQRAAALRGSSR